MNRFSLSGTSENCRKKHSFAGKARLWYTAIVLLLVLAGMGCYSWYSTRVHYIRQSLQLSKAELQVEVYNAGGENVHGINSNLTTDSNYHDHLNTQTTVINGGSELSFDSSGNGTATFYAQAKNTGDINLDLYMQVILNGSDYYERIGDYIRSCVVDITDEIGDETLGDYIADNTLHGAEYLESVTDKTTVRYEGTKLTDLQDLKYLAELPNSAADSSTHYYRIELWNNGWPTNVSSQQLDFAFMLYGKQAGMPIGSGTSTDVYTVTNENEFEDALTRAADGSTILVSADMVISNAVTFNNAVNLCINGCTLRVKSDLNYDFSTQADCSISLIGDGALIIDGNLNIDAPSSNFTISGSGAGSTVKLGTGIAGGNLYVNAALYPTDPSQGFRLANVSVQKKTLTQTYQAAELAVDSQTNVIVSTNTTIGTIRAMEGASNIYVYIYGTVEGAVDLREMAENTPSYTERSYPVSSGSAPNGLDQIYVYVYGSVEPADDSYRFCLPDWAKSSQNETAPTVGNSNTRIYYDVHTGINDVSGYVNPINYSGTFVSSNIEIEAYTQNTVVRMNPHGAGYIFNDREYENAYRVAIVNYACNNDLWVNGINLSGLGNGSFIMQQVLADYFLTAENDPLSAHNAKELREAIAAIDYIEILSVQPQGEAPETIKAQDLYYISGNAQSSTYAAYEYPMSGISAINLTNTSVPDNILPAESMKNCRASVVTLPSELTAIGADAFDNAGCFEISIPGTVTNIAAGAFDISADNGASGYLFVTLEHDGELTGDIMQGFNDSGDKQFIFVKPVVNKVFHSHFTFSAGGTINEAEYNGISRNWYYKVYETAALSENSVDSSNVRTIRLTRRTVSGAETALLLLSDTSGYDIINTNAEYAKLFPETIDGRKATGVGDRAFSHLGITGFTLNLDFTDSAGELDLSRYEHIGAEVFKQKNGGGITIPVLELGGIREIGDYAFFGAKIGTSAARPADFAGMTGLGRYAFCGCTVGSAPASQAAANAFHSGTNGALDLTLQPNKNVTAGDYALASANIYGCTVKLTNSEVINATVFNGTSFYACYLDISGTGTLKENAMKDKTKTAVGAYTVAGTDLMAADIPKLEGESLASSWRSATLGLKSDALRSANAAEDCSHKWGGGQNMSVFGSNRTIGTLIFDGDLPADSPYAMRPNVNGCSLTCGSVTFTENCTTAIPAYLFCTTSSRYIYIGALSVASTVPAVGDCAFICCRNITGPNGVLDLSGKTICYWAFESSMITATELNLNGTHLGENSFRSCSVTNLETLTIENASADGSPFTFLTLQKLTALTLINCDFSGEYLFGRGSAPNLTTLTATDSSIGALAFSSWSAPKLTTVAFTGCSIGKSMMNSLSFPELTTLSLTDCSCIGDSAFNALKAPKLETLTVSVNNVSGGSIGNYSFENMTMSATAVCTLNVTNCDGFTVGNNAFQGCTAIRTISLGSGGNQSSNVSFGQEAFKNCTGLTGGNFDGLTYAGNYCFNGCTSLKKFESSTLASAGWCTFIGCTGLVYVNCPTWKEFNGNSSNTFDGCTKLRVVETSYNFAKGISGSMFKNCGTNLRAWIIHSPIGTGTLNCASDNSSGLFGDKVSIPSTFRIVVPEDYKTKLANPGGASIVAATGEDYAWADDTTNTLSHFMAADGTTPMSDYGYGDYLYEVVDGKAAMLACFADSITGVYTVPTLGGKTVTRLGNGCFKGQTAMTSFMGKSLTTIGTGVFTGCTELTTFTANALIALPNDGFLNVTSLATVNAAELTTAGDNCFKGCTGLTMVNFPALQTAGKNCFSGCTGLIKFESSALTSVGLYCFSGCTSLVYVNCPALEEFTDIGPQTFSGCASLRIVETSFNFSKWAMLDFFKGCSNIKAWIIHNPSGTGNLNFYNAGSMGLFGFNIAIPENFRIVINSSYSGKITGNGKAMIIATTGENYAWASDTTNTMTHFMVADGTIPMSDYGCGDYLYEVDGSGNATMITCFADITGAYTVPTLGGKTVTKLGNGCFRNQTAMTSFTGNSITTADRNCFKDCTGLTAVNLGVLQTAGQYCFSGCTGLTSFESGTLTTAGTYCFQNCTGLVCVNCPVLAEFSDTAPCTFSGCTSLRIAETSFNFTKPQLGSMFDGCAPNLRAWIIHNPSGTTSVSSNNWGPKCLFGAGKGLPSTFGIVINSSHSGKITDYGNATIIATTGEDYAWASDTTNTMTHFTAAGGTTPMSDYGCGDYLYEIVDGKATMLACFADITGAYTAPTIGGKTVTKLYNKCFANQTAMTSFTGNSITTFGTGVFTGCTGLTSFTANALTTISAGVFTGCTGFTTFTANTLTDLPNDFFLNFTSLTTVNAASLTTLGNNCFRGCTGLTTVNLPALQTAGQYCFSGCTSLRKFESSTLASVKEFCFSGCTGLVYVNCPALKEFNAHTTDTFNGCTNLRVVETSFYFSRGYCCNLFKGCNNIRAWIIHNPSGTGTLICYSGESQSMFGSNVSIPATFKIIVNSSYSGKIVRYGNASFITTTGEDYAWASDTTNTDLSHFSDGNGNPMSDYGCDDYLYEIDGSGNATMLTCFADITGAYTVPETLGGKTVTKLGNGCFKGQTAMTSFTGNSITTFGTGVFTGCTGFTTFTANALTDLPNDFFLNFTSLTTVNSASITTLGNNCFRGCTGLTTVNLPALQTAGQYCFSGCTGLTKFESDTLATAGTYCFSDCTGLVYVNCPALKYFGLGTNYASWAFYNCTNLRVVETSFAFNAPYLNCIFQNCQNNLRAWIIHDPGPGESILTCRGGSYGLFFYNVSLPSSFRIVIDSDYTNKIIGIDNAAIITTTGEDYAWASDTTNTDLSHFSDGNGNPMFDYGCGDYLYEIVDGKATMLACFADITGAYTVPTIGGKTVTKLYNKCFANQTAMTAFTGNSLTTLPDYCFQNCTNLATLNLAVLQTAGTYCFSGCTGLTSFESDTLTKTGTYCFNGCTGLVYVKCMNLKEFSGTHETHTFDGCTNLRVAETSFDFSSKALGSLFKNCAVNLRAWIIHNPGDGSINLSCNSGYVYDNYNMFGGGTIIPSTFRIVVDSSFSSKITGYGNAAIIATTGEDFAWAIDTTNSGLAHFSDGNGNPMSDYGYGDYLYNVDGSGSTALLACFADSITGTYTVPSVLGSGSVKKIGANAYKGVAFADDSSIEIPEGVTTVEDCAFASANAYSVFLPATLTALGTNTFSGSNIKDIYLITDPAHTDTADRVTAEELFGSETPADVRVYMDRNAYENVYTQAWGGIPRVQFIASEYIVTIDGVTFYLDEYGSGYIVSVVVNGRDKEAVRFPESYTDDEGTKNVIAIGTGALESLKNSTTITSFKIPRTLLDFCVDYTLIPASLAEYTMEGPGTKYSVIDGVLYTSDGSTIINYPRGKTETEFTVPERVSYVAAGAFTDCASLETVNVNAALSFAGNAVENCCRLAVLNLPDDGFCRFLGRDTFNGTKSNFRIYVPSGTAEQYIKYILCDDAVMKLLAERAAPAADWDFAVLNDTDIRLVRSLVEISEGDGNGTVTLLIPSQVESTDGDIYTVTALGGNLLNGCAYTEIYIPGSVLDIDTAMFDGSAVCSICVADENPNYCAYNGMLLSKNRSTLYRLMPAVTGDVTLEGVAAVANGALNDTQAESIDLSSVEYMGTNDLSVRETPLEIRSFNPIPAVSLGESMFGSAGAHLAITVADGCAERYKTAAGWCRYAEYITEDYDADAGVPETVYLSEDGWSYSLVTQDDGTAGAVLTSVDEPDEELPEETPVMTSFTSGTAIMIPDEVDGYAVVGLSANFDTHDVSAFDVASENSMFSAENGVLFSKDGSVLIRYPAGNEATDYAIYEGVTVAGYAFRDAVNLETISMTSSTFRTMGERAFEGCESLTGIIISDIVPVTMMCCSVPEPENTIPVTAENSAGSGWQATEPAEQISGENEEQENTGTGPQSGEPQAENETPNGKLQAENEIPNGELSGEPETPNGKLPAESLAENENCSAEAPAEQTTGSGTDMEDTPQESAPPEESAAENKSGPEIPCEELPSEPEISDEELPSEPEIPIGELPTEPEIPIGELPAEPEIPIGELPPESLAEQENCSAEIPAEQMPESETDMGEIPKETTSSEETSSVNKPEDEAPDDTPSENAEKLPEIA